jgi:hypothetical protein
VNALKIILILLAIYVGIVVAFESLLGYFQPAGQTTLVITTTYEDGATNDRVLARLDSDGQLYVAVNHWPRAWYGNVQQRPNVQVTLDGDKGDYIAHTVSGEEYDRVNGEHSLGTVFRILTGFPRRYIVRLDPT